MASKGSPLHGPRIKLTEKAQNLFAETKEHTFESKAAEEHAKLIRSDTIKFFKLLASYNCITVQGRASCIGFMLFYDWIRSNIRVI